MSEFGPTLTGTTDAAGAAIALPVQQLAASGTGATEMYLRVATSNTRVASGTMTPFASASVQIVELRSEPGDPAPKRG